MAQSIASLRRQLEREKAKVKIERERAEIMKEMKSLKDSRKKGLIKDFQRGAVSIFKGGVKLADKGLDAAARRYQVEQRRASKKKRR